MNVLRVGGFAGLLLMVGILAGCSLFFPNDSVDQASKGSNDISSSWLIAAQGQASPPQCVSALSRGQAKRLAEKILNAKQEAKLLKQALTKRGKKLILSKAHGCKVKGKAKGQGLSAMQTSGDEATLIEVPAGSDAALYLLEKETAGEGNYWASLKGSDAGGERLIHVELGLGEETGVQGPSTEPAEVSLFLPDEVGTQELAADLQALLESDTTAVGLTAMQTQTMDWANAEVILDDTQVTVLEDGTQEMEALVVVPAVDSTAGQALWDRTRPMIDEERATYVKVTVKKTPPQPSNPRPQLQVVKPTLERPHVQPVVKNGSELGLNQDYNFCPFQHYGRLQYFRKSLCQSWRLPWTLDRSSRTLADSYNTVSSSLTALNIPKGGIAALGNRERALVLAGFENVTSELVSALYRQSQESTGTQEVEAQEVDITLLCNLIQTSNRIAGIVSGFLCDLVAGSIVDWINARSEQERQRILGLIQELQAASDFEIQLANSVIGDSLFEQFLQGVRNVWIQAGILSPDRPSLLHDGEFKALLQQVLSYYKSHGAEAAVAVAHLGSAALSVPMLLEYYLRQVVQDPRFPAMGASESVKVIVGLLPKLIPGSLAMTDAQKLVTLLAGLVGGALTGQPADQARELITRVLGTFQLASDLTQRGWVIKRLAVPSEETGGIGIAGYVGIAVDLVAKKQIAGLEYCGTCQVAAYTILEPYLESSAQNPKDLNTLIGRVVQAILFASASFSKLYETGTLDAWRVVVVFIDQVAPGADPTQVCSAPLVQTYSSQRNVPVVVVQGGRVVCHTDNISAADAQKICQEQGKCSEPPPGDYPSGEGFTPFVIWSPGPESEGSTSGGVRLMSLGDKR
jgi:hypothetical protein